MTTRLTKAITRLVDIQGEQWNVSLTADGVMFRQYKKRTGLLLPYPPAIVRAAMLKADSERAAKGLKRKPRRRTRGKL